MASEGTLYTEYHVVLNVCLLVQIEECEGERYEGQDQGTNLDTNLPASRYWSDSR